MCDITKQEKERKPCDVRDCAITLDGLAAQEVEKIVPTRKNQLS